MIKDVVGSVDGFGGEAQERHLMYCVRIHGRGTGFEVKGVQVECQGLVKKNALVTGTEEIKGRYE